MLACTLSLTVCPPAGVSAGAIFRPVVGLMWTPTKDMKLINPALGCLGIHSNTRAVSGRGFSFFRTGEGPEKRLWSTERKFYPTWFTAFPYTIRQMLSGSCTWPIICFFSCDATQWLGFLSPEGCTLYSLSAECAAEDRSQRPPGFNWAVSLERSYHTGSDAQRCQPKA